MEGKREERKRKKNKMYRTIRRAYTIR